MTDATRQAYAHMAGLTYILVLVFDITGLVITSAIAGGGSFTDQSRRIAEWETLYRIGILCGLVGSLSTILLAVSLYVVLKPIDINLALMGLLFRVVESVGGAGIAFGFTSLQVHLDATREAGTQIKSSLGAGTPGHGAE